MITKNDVLESGIFDFKIFPPIDNDFPACKGENRKGLLLVMKDEPALGLTTFLDKVLQAVGHNRNADALSVFLTDDQKFSFLGFAEKNAVEKALFFGVLPARVGLNINPRPYLPSSLSGRDFVFVHDLSAIEQDQELKAKLWKALQLMFPNPS